MLVVCINDSWKGDYTAVSQFPKFAGTYNVIKEGFCPCGFCGKKVFHLAQFDEEVGWAADHFAPVSSIDETEMIREYNTEKV